jgi:formate--tetrahydrofolate ligase
MNDRSLRDKFDITAASEIMAIVCLSSDMKDLRARISRIVVARTTHGKDVYAKDLKVVGAMMVILKDAMMPNIVATKDGCMAFVHGGPFGNIAHGCSSILATRAALTYGDVCITEAGFGADLGAEKFFNIKLRALNKGNKEKVWPHLVVLVATLKSIKEQGDGYANLMRHVENMRLFGCEVIVAINKFKNDNKKELTQLIDYCTVENVPAFLIDCFDKGRDGGDEIAQYIRKILKNTKTMPKEKYLYTSTLSLRDKIEAIATKIYRAKEVVFSKDAEHILSMLEASPYKHFPVCLAKNQYSFTDDETKRGAPSNHIFHVNDLKLYAGSGFVTVYAGKIFTMPGLSRSPALEHIDLNDNGEIVGLK